MNGIRLFGMIVCTVIAAGCVGKAQPDFATVTVNPAIRYQTIRGWSCNPWYLEASAELRNRVLDEAVNELGLTRIRWQQPSGNRASMRRWEWLNDNGDPDSTDLSKFDTAAADRFVATYLLPFKQRVEANGDPFELWLSPSFFDGGSTGSIPAWMLHSPGEYAEFAVSFLLYLKNKYHVEATHYVICNEPGNNNAFTPAVVAEMTKELGRRLKAAGLSTTQQFCDGVNARATWRYIQAVKDDLDLWKYVDLLTYHWYGKNNQEFMDKVRRFAVERGMMTGQTEFMHLTLNHLYDDLTVGGVSYWSIYGLGGPGPGGQNFHFHLNNTSFDRGRQFWNFRQVMHYVRPGAVRVEARSNDAAVRPLAFVHRGKVTVILLNNSTPARARLVRLSNLPAGVYGICGTVGTKPYQEFGLRTVAPGRSLVVDMPADGCVTVYPHPERNLPPTMTRWKAKPDHLTVPAAHVTLSAAAQDPELDPLSYSWKVNSHPPRAQVMLASPQAATTEATGLTVPGRYVFRVMVGDGRNTVTREVLVNVYDANQPPIILDLHNRIPVQVTLPQDNTLLMAAARDLEGDKLAYKWTVAKQPVGAAVRLETPTARACKVVNIRVPGDYVFRFEVSDGLHTVSQALTVPVYPVNTPPVISAVAASPSRLTLPRSSTVLSAVTSDPDGDILSHWWRTAKAPAGAKPIFTKQCGRTTGVTGLMFPGVYTFTLTVVDRTEFAAKAVTVTVSLRKGA